VSSPINRKYTVYKKR